MRAWSWFVAIAAATFLWVPPGWHATLDAGLGAAKKSGKPLLVVTAWSNEQ